MEARKKNSQDAMRKVLYRNGLLDFDLQRENAKIDRMMNVVKKETKQIEQTRKHIAEEINARREQEQSNRIFNLLQGNNSTEKDFIYRDELSQSKQNLESALERAKAFRLFPDGDLNDRPASHYSQDTLPEITNRNGNFISNKDSNIGLNSREINPNEKVRRYIEQMNLAERHLTDRNNRPATRNTAEQSIKKAAAVNRQDDISISNNNNIDEKESRLAIVKSTRKPIAKVLNRRHSVMGMTLNVPFLAGKSPKPSVKLTNGQSDPSLSQYGVQEHAVKYRNKRRNSVPLITACLRNDRTDQNQPACENGGHEVTSSSESWYSTAKRHSVDEIMFRRSSVPIVNLDQLRDFKKFQDSPLVEESVSSEYSSVISGKTEKE